MIKRTYFFRISFGLENGMMSKMSGVIYHHSIFSDAYFVYLQAISNSKKSFTKKYGNQHYESLEVTEFKRVY